MNYSIVVPTYRGSKTIRELFNQIRAVFDELNLTFEVIFVFDDGPDDSWKIIKELVSENAGFVKGIKLNRNFGQHNATICGFKYAAGNFIITLDEDLQHDPKDINALIQKQIENDYDVIYGKISDRKHSSFRNLTSGMLNGLLRVGIPELHKDYSSFRLIKTSIAKETLNMNNSYTFLDGYLTWLTRHVASAPVSHRNSGAQSSSYNLKKLIEHSINIFVTFSNLPIRFITWLSTILIIFSSC
jgi:undecaprenyl-phosphate 4-deoxy-4-formamido-L-arabinose transferase